MTDHLKDFASLLKEGRKKPIESPVEIVAPGDLKTLLTEIRQEKLKQKEELREKATEVIPKLGDFFGALVASKKALDEVSTEVIASVEEETEVPVIEQASVVVEVIEEAQNAIEEITELKDAVVSDKTISELQEAVKILEIRLTKEVKQLKSMIQQSTKTVVNHTSSGGGEVLFRRLDDVNLSGLQDGDFLAWDASQARFVNIRPPIGGSGSGIVGGQANQVLVKKSGTNYDYEWQDMIVTQQEYTKLIDDVSTISVTYIGEAVPGTTQSATSWRIRKILFDANGNVDSVMFAGSGDFGYSWVNRIAISYN